MAPFNSGRTITFSLSLSLSLSFFCFIRVAFPFHSSEPRPRSVCCLDVFRFIFVFFLIIFSRGWFFFFSFSFSSRKRSPAVAQFVLCRHHHYFRLFIDGKATKMGNDIALPPDSRETNCRVFLPSWTVRFGRLLGCIVFWNEFLLFLFRLPVFFLPTGTCVYQCFWFLNTSKWFLNSSELCYLRWYWAITELNCDWNEYIAHCESNGARFTRLNRFNPIRLPFFPAYSTVRFSFKWPLSPLLSNRIDLLRFTSLTPFFFRAFSAIFPATNPIKPVILGFYRVLPFLPCFYRIFHVRTESWLISLGVTEFYLVLPSFTGFY